MHRKPGSNTGNCISLWIFDFRAFQPSIQEPVWHIAKGCDNREPCWRLVGHFSTVTCLVRATDNRATVSECAPVCFRWTPPVPFGSATAVRVGQQSAITRLPREAAEWPVTVSLRSTGSGNRVDWNARHSPYAALPSRHRRTTHHQRFLPFATIPRIRSLAGASTALRWPSAWAAAKDIGRSAEPRTIGVRGGLLLSHRMTR
jgi:hypothetical protein